MKKFFLFALLFAATAMFADDAVVVEAFSQVVQTGSSGATGAKWTGDVCNWSNKYTRRGASDLINGKQASWITLGGEYGYLETTNFEGGIKSVAFDYAQFGSENGKILKWIVIVDTDSITAERDGDKGANKDNPESFSHLYACKKNVQLKILNGTIMDNGTKPSSNGRLLVGDITITPYLLYTTKIDTLDLRKGVNTFKNEDLINNTDEGDVVYSISENEIGATIDAATGVVTADLDGEVTVTATWGAVTTSYQLTILSKIVTTASFAEESLLVMVDGNVPENEFSTNSTADVEYSSSDESVATVNAETGEVAIVGVGTTIITANVLENDDYKPASASYKLRIVPLNFNLETFDGAVNATGNATYHTNDSITPRSNAGIVWTTHLGSVRDNLGQSGTQNIAAVIRSKKNTEEEFGYLASDVISGGIDSLAFDWNANGTEASRTQPWNIVIYINGDSVGAIHDAGAAVQPMGSWFRFSIGNLKIDGDFSIMFKNLNVPDDGTSNQYRWVVDNIEWYSYEAPCEGQYGILVDGTKYIAGVKNEEQKEWLEYTITADLNKDQTFVFEDHCTGGTFMAGQDNGEGNYKFNYTEGENPAFLVPQDGHFTIYLKMYGPDNNWIWTVYADPTTGIENTAMKADVRKAIENGQIVIYRNGVRYSLQGQAF